MISAPGVVISVTLLSLVNKKFVKLKSWLYKSCWQWKGANRKWSWFFDISFGSKVIAKKHKHTNERRSRCPRALCRNLLSRCHVQSISYVKTKSRVKCAFPMSLLSFVHMHACCQCPVVQNLLAVLIGKCWAGTGEHRPYIIGTGQVFENFQNASFVIIGCFHLWERSVWAVECLTALYTGPLWVTDSWAGSLLTGWLHTVSLYPLTGRFRYPCESGASRRKPDVNSRWRET